MFKYLPAAHSGIKNSFIRWMLFAKQIYAIICDIKRRKQTCMNASAVRKNAAACDSNAFVSIRTHSNLACTFRSQYVNQAASELEYCRKCACKSASQIDLTIAALVRLLLVASPLIPFSYRILFYYRLKMPGCSRLGALVCCLSNAGRRHGNLFDSFTCTLA